MTGLLIAFEGADASGKSTQARRLAQRIRATLTFQFGATEIGGAIRSILLDPLQQDLDDRTEAMLVVADKAQHVAEIVAPALARGETVISDRFTSSGLAYQGYGRGLNLSTLAEMMNFATRGLSPDLTVLLDVDLELARARLGNQIDRIEGAGAAFHERVRAGYLEMAAAEKEKWLVVDAAGTVDDVARRVDEAFDRWMTEGSSS